MYDNRIAIIGAGQAGALLALKLKLQGYNITLYNDKTVEQIKNGRIISSQVTFHEASQIEMEYKIKELYANAPKNHAILLNIMGLDINSFTAKTVNPYYSIDLRLKTSAYIELFIENYGDFRVERIDIDRLQEISSINDLVIIASGKFLLNDLFKINYNETVFTESKRNYCCIYVTNINQTDEHRGLRMNMLPGLGEFFITPGLTLSGPCEMMLFEAIHNSEFDFWNKDDSNEITLAKAKDVLKKYLPLEAERLTHSQLTDAGAVLMGSYPPVIRHPIVKLDNNKSLLGIADAIVLNDPIAGQGANNAIKAAKIYSDRIIKNNNQDFSDDWMNNTFQEFWQTSGKYSTKLSNTLLMPDKEKLKKIFLSAFSNEKFATDLVGCFDKPEAFVKIYDTI